MTGKSQYVLNYLAQAVASPYVTGGSRYIGSTVSSPDLLFEDCEIAPYTEDFPKPPFWKSPLGIK
jgi:hypothetical protein